MSTPTTTPTTTSATAGAGGRRANRRHRRFARLWRSVAPSVHEQMLDAKRDVLTDLPDVIVEIGPGCGSNFELYPRGAHVIAVEPNANFDHDLRQAAAEHDIDLELRRDLLVDRLPAASVDVVVSTLVLCSVPEPREMIAEIERILRPGGRLLFVEHVAAPERGVRRAYQRLVRRPWRWVGDGCDPCADTVTLVAASGLVTHDEQLEPIGSRFDPTNLTWWGTATRPPM